MTAHVFKGVLAVKDECSLFRGQNWRRKPILITVKLDCVATYFKLYLCS